MEDTITKRTYTEKKEAKSTKKRVQSLVVTALFIALVYIFTAFINFRLPFGGEGGLVHLGNIPLFIGAIVFGKKTGAIAGGIGMAMFDVLSGWTAWAPFTLIIVGAMGFATGWVTEKRRGYAWSIVAMGLALIIKIVGYYIAEALIYGNWVTPAASVPGNVMQVGTAIVVVAMVAESLKKCAEKILFE